ncbi:ATP-binding protein [Sporosarcina oncorhynchi]|uniref:Oxygen sensor histidine kinase NreB n=1 Tax=Sporosarcina oncorhynchi TaxID=3056444 RepID=A0ABZ0L7A1_9BACL|nr:ATP-binding protein [Sporosarcina sp. T2O-4]WOV88112.1 ATP-binding protein [Sporosarcina sp. T2O-4]
MREIDGQLIRNPSSMLHLGFVYRTISLLLTSCVFFIGTPSPLIFKVGVVFGLIVAGWIIADLQRKYIQQRKILKLLVVIETVGLTCLLLPTGGIVSPFIWYALNPVLVAASFLTPFFAWGILAVYLGSATLIATRFGSFEEIINDISIVYLVSTLTILLATLFSQLTRELLLQTVLLEKQQGDLVRINEQLTETNTQSRIIMEHIMSYYRLMDVASSTTNPRVLMDNIAASVATCTQSNSVFFWLTTVGYENNQFVNRTANVELEADLKKAWSTIQMKPGTFISKIGDELYFMKIVRTSVHVGVIGVEVSADVPITHTFLFRRPFEFLANLSEILLEQMHMEQLKNQFIINEEQNRIANEIHDSVAQRLFGISYSLHGLRVRKDTITAEELDGEYAFLSESAQTTIKELRSAIYRLSSFKKGETPFFDRLTTYLDEYARLNAIRIDYALKGHESLIFTELKEVLYRVICEACGNATRHGNATVIKVTLVIMETVTTVEISDNGRGFSTSKTMKLNEQGIGLMNMKNSVASFGGSFLIEAEVGTGTTVQIELPVVKKLKEQEVAGL